MIGLLAVARQRVGGSGNQPPAAPDPRTIDSTESVTLDWANAATVVTASQIPNCLALREQDDVVYDAVNGRHAHYFTAECYISGTGAWWEVWVVHSTDGITWGAPVQCTLDTGGALRGQDPSIVTTMSTTALTIHHDADDRMWMYLENHPDPSNHDVHAYSSADGINWTLEMLNVIPRGASGTWDTGLIGSPNARYIDGTYVVGYEGGGLGEESWGVATGPTPIDLTKSPANPLIRGLDHGVGPTCFMDSWWLSTDGSRIMVTGHSGGDNGTFMPRFYTANTDPLTWVAEDFIYLNESDASLTARNDLTVHMSADRLITAPANDATLLAVPLA